MIEWIVANREWLFSGLGIAVFAGLVGLLRRRKPQLADPEEASGEPQEVDLRFFTAPSQARYNLEFYDYFLERISRATRNIYITGDGFECADEEGTKLAGRFTQAFRHCLDRGVRVVRVQTRCESHHQWAKMLADLMREFSDNFELYVLKAGAVTQMSSVCVIDPEDDENSVVEIMLSTQKLFGTRAADLAGTAVFIERSQSLSRDLRQRILSLTTAETSFRPRTSDEVFNLLAGRELYFAYGSNMSAEQMSKRASSARSLGVGLVDDHELVFNRRGSYRPGGVASIAPARGKRVYGLIYELSGADLVGLDQMEDPEAYRRVRKLVVGLDGSSYQCHLYEAIPTGRFDPDPEYLRLLIEAAEKSGLPDAYVDELRGLRS